MIWLQHNADGSADVWFAPQLPAGKEPNWLYTAPGWRWIAAFCFYGPEPAIRDKTWALPDIEKTRQ